MQIPGDLLIEHAMSANPHGRMTTVDDIAQAIVTLSSEGTHWITGNVLGVDGGELSRAERPQRTVTDTRWTPLLPMP
jgi:NAD(P)-dependent dehydrogenase (short-subunit alcohol dehydrogenase family)